jgi:hypothetical protein
MNFFDSFWKKSFYQNKSGKSFLSALLKFLLINFALSVIYAVTFYVTFGRHIPDYFSDISNKIESGYPKELVLTIKSGVLSKNIPGDLKLYPVESFFPSTEREESIDTATPKYFVSIDETKEASIPTYDRSDSFLFFGKDGLVARGDNEIKIIPYTRMQGNDSEKNFSKETIAQGIGFVRPHIWSVAPALSMLIVVMYSIFATVAGLFVALAIALVVMVLSKWILKNKTGYRDSYVYVLYALPVAVIAEKILVQIPYVADIVAYIPFLTTIVVVAFLWYMFDHSSEKDKSTAE